MSDSFIRVPADSNGKSVDTSQVTVSGVVVQRERSNFADPVDPLGLASVKNTDPLLLDYGVVVRAIASSCLAYSKISQATNNADVIKNSTGIVYGYAIYNQAGYAIFIKLYNKATPPNPATDAALLVRTIGIQGGTAIAYVLEKGLSGFTNGIGIAITLHAASNDNTPVVAGDCITNVDYL